MSAQMINSAPMTQGEAEYVTIVAKTIDEAMRQFRASDLAAQGFCITGRVARHRFSYAGEANDPTSETDLFGGARMIAATFMRMPSRD